jgi:hypothetical protein
MRATLLHSWKIKRSLANLPSDFPASFYFFLPLLKKEKKALAYLGSNLNEHRTASHRDDQKDADVPPRISSGRRREVRHWSRINKKRLAI